MSGALVWKESCSAAKGMKQAEGWEGKIVSYVLLSGSLLKCGPQNGCGLRDSETKIVKCHCLNWPPPQRASGDKKEKLYMKIT